MPTGIGMEKVAKNACDTWGNVTKHKRNGSIFINNKHAWEPIWRRSPLVRRGP